MYKIQANASGTRHISVSEDNLRTIEKYALLGALVPSNGIIDESTLDKLRQNVRSFIGNNDDCADLIDLCRQVLFHDNMKVFGLRELIMLYVSWSEEKDEN